MSLVNGSIKAVDGPFIEAKELIGGYAVLEVRSKAEAVELARRLMQIHKDHWPVGKALHVPGKEVVDSTEYIPRPDPRRLWLSNAPESLRHNQLSKA